MQAWDVLPRSFFARDTLVVAEQLLGHYLIRYLPGETAPLIVRIVETEAYKGAEDAASHAYRGCTPRNQVMFGDPGKVYVYFTYGMHYCMNIVCEQAGVAGAVLLRGATAVAGVERMHEQRSRNSNSRRWSERQLLNGPAKLTQALAIDLAFNGADALDSSPLAPLTLAAPHNIKPPTRIERTPRIGISRAQELAWRFVAHYES